MEDKIKKIFEIQKQFTNKFFQEKYNYTLDTISNDDKIKWSKEFILSCSKELFEALDETPWKQHRFVGQQHNIDNFLEECIDSFKFLLNLMILNGCDEKQFFDKFLDKSNVVEIRYEQEKQLKTIKNSKDKFVVFDIDGVLNNYPYNFMDYAKQQGIDYNDLSEFRLKDNVLYRSLKKKFRESGQERNNVVNPFAKETLLFFRNKGFKIILLTARPYKKHSRLFADTLSFLDQHELVYDFIFFDEKKEELLIDTFTTDQIEFVIDDDINNVNKYKSYFKNIYLIENYGLYLPIDYQAIKYDFHILPDLRYLMAEYLLIDQK